MKFPIYQPEHMMSRIERAGKYVVASEISGVGYMIENGMIGILAGKDGTLAVDIDKAEYFIKEFAEIVQLAKDRRCLQIKGA
ncbi:MAG: hypothetical protein LLG05_18920 [Porphyromonadaceae bacterium]|nr:hypothetical protein [Porphyromonadaceae bacterium]